MTLAEFRKLQARTQESLDALLRDLREITFEPDGRDLRPVWDKQDALYAQAEEVATRLGDLATKINAAYADQVTKGEPHKSVHYLAPQDRRQVN